MTSSALTGTCPTVVLTPESLTCLIIQPPSPLPSSWHYGVIQAKDITMYAFYISQQGTEFKSFIFQKCV